MMCIIKIIWLKNNDIIIKLKRNNNIWSIILLNISLWMKLHHIKFWYQKQKNKLMIWFEKTNIFLYCCRKITYIIMFYIFLINIRCGIIFSLFIPYVINRYCWDILTTWFYVDYIYGFVYKNTENIKSFKEFLARFKISSKPQKKKKNIYKYINLINIYLCILIIYNSLLNYNSINTLSAYVIFIPILLYYIKKNWYYKNNKYIYMWYFKILYINVFKLLNIFLRILNILNKNIHFYIMSIQCYLKNFINNIYTNILTYLQKKQIIIVDLIKHSIESDVKLEYDIYIYNKKLILKNLKHKINLSMIYFLDNLEYNLISNKSLYKKKNIIKLHKKPKTLKRIKSKIELNLELIRLTFYRNIKLYLYYYITMLNDLGYVYNFNYIIPNNSKKYSLNNNINFNNKTTIYLNKIIYIIYLPPYLLNYIISDINLSITYLLILLKKKYFLNILIRVIWLFIKKIKSYTRDCTKWFLKSIKNIIYIFVKKTIYITLFFCYFYNKDTSIFILYNIYNEFIFNKLIIINNIYIINIFLNINFLYVLTTILGIQLILFWSKNVHKLFGQYLWSMTIFPLFLETHKILYYKLLCINLLNFNTFDFIFTLKYNILGLLNFKLYNIYNTFTSLYLILLIIFFIRLGAFKHIYSSLLNSRWKYIKFPIIIYLFEIFRLKIVEYITSYYMYLILKHKIYIYILNFIIKLSNNKIYLILIDFIQEFIWDISPFSYFSIYTMFNLNIYLINFLIDSIIIYIALIWILSYLNEYKKIDLKFVAFPLVTTEIILKYYIIYLLIYYFSQYIYIWALDGTILWHLFRVSLISLIYLEIRVHKVPRKTMPWYFRQIVELWPSTYFNQWYTNEYLYIDQQRYIVLRFRLKTFKISYRDIYKKCEIWNKIIILNYQKEKDKVTKQLTSFCRIMSRKENMLREINNFEYQGWYEDWQYNYYKINIYSWKLDFWDKPYMYQFKKTVFFSNIKFHFFFYSVILERYALKHMHLTYLYFFTNIMDFYYTNIYIYILSTDDISNLSRKEWKKLFFKEYNILEEYTHLKKLKLILMSFSSGENIKTPDWIFPPMYEKQYKLEGWSMFEDPKIDEIELDWRPNLKDLN